MDNTELLARYILSRTLWWKYDLEGLRDEAVAELVKQLEIDKTNLRKQFDENADMLADITASGEWTHEQLMAINQWADEVLDGSKTGMANIILATAVTIGLTSSAMANRILSFDGEAKAVRILEPSREEVAGWFDETILGKGSSRGLVNTAYDDGVKLSVMEALRQSEAGSPPGVIRQNLDRALDEGIVVTQREVETVFDTYAQTGEATAFGNLYERNSHLIKGYRRVEVLDNKTCLLCALMDGEYYDVNERLPFYSMPHPRCRGSWVPVFKSWQSLGFDSERTYQNKAREWALRDPEPLGANGRKLRNHGKTTENYGGWWASLTPEEKAITSIGKVRTKLLEEGKIQWHDMLDRATGRVKTLEELGYGKMGKKIP